jgi:hypothetical protein
MRKKKPFSTLQEPVGPPDHFTVEEAHAAVLAVMAARGEAPRPDPSAKWLHRPGSNGAGPAQAVE